MAHAALVSTDAASAPSGGESVGQLRSRCTAGAASPGPSLVLQALAAFALLSLWAGDEISSSTLMCLSNQYYSY